MSTLPSPAIQIGPHQLTGQVMLAPMAGISDQPFRRLCLERGAALATSEMLHSDQRLWQSRKSQQRLTFDPRDGLASVQIAGADPTMLAQAASACEALGAQMIDINMGCPAKKVCNALAGSALLTDPTLVAQILEAVVQAVAIPVTLKIRTGPCRDSRNARLIAHIAEQSGIAALVIHGRTRADRFKGEAEYHTIAEVKAHSSLPIIANGDITSGHEARRVLNLTQADGLMVGRAAQGDPWIFGRIQRYLDTGQQQPLPQASEICETLLQHLETLETFYGSVMGPRIGRKHIGWYLKNIPGGEELRRLAMPLEQGHAQRELIDQWFTIHQPEVACAA
ncbi:MAG: tRNA dihydrouridine synthase DusB [Lysobacterales bacterium]